MSFPRFSSAVVIVSEKTRAEAMRQGLNDIGIPFVHLFQQPAEADHALELDPDALLVLEWAADDYSGSVLLLEKLAQREQLSVRPVVLWGRDQMDAGVRGLMQEFSLSAYFFDDGPLDQPTLKSCLESLDQIPELHGERVEKLRACQQLEREGLISEAESLLQELLDRTPEDVGVLVKLANLYWRHQRVDEAYGLLKEAYDEGERDVRICHWLGLCQWQRKSVTKALELWRQAEHLNPYRSERLLLMAELHWQQDQKNKALDLWAKAYQTYSASREVSQRYLEALTILERWHEFEQQLRGIAEPALVASLANHAALRAIREGRLEGAKTVFYVAMQLLHDDYGLLAKLCFNLGHLYFRERMLPVAARFFVIASRLDPAHQASRDNWQALAAYVDLDDLPEESDQLRDYLLQAAVAPGDPSWPPLAGRAELA